MNRIQLSMALGATILGFGLLELHKVRFEREITGGAMVDVVAVTRDVPVGHRLGRDDIETRRVPTRFSGRRAVRGGDARELLGARVRHGLTAGDALLYDDLALGVSDRSDLSSLVPDGLRAVSVRADAFDGLLRPGDRVDVLLAEGTLVEDGEPAVRRLLQGALVLAVGGNTSPNSEPARSGSVVLAVTIPQASTMAQSRGLGALTLALRNPADLAVDLDGEPVSDSPGGRDHAL